MLSTTTKPGNMLPFSLLGTLLLYLSPVPRSSNPPVDLNTQCSSDKGSLRALSPHPSPPGQLPPPTLGLSPGMSGRLQARPPPPTLPPSLLLFLCTSGPRLTRPGLLPIPPNPWYLSLPLSLCNSFFLGLWWSFLHFLFVSQKILSTNFFCLKNPI